MDPRDFANIECKWHGEVNEKDMTCEVTVTNWNEDDIQVDTTHCGIPFKYEVCDLCDGKGRHVNPGIDSNGLTSEDFDQDPDFREDYLNGTYDVSCYKCGGSRVMVVYDETRANDKIKAIMKDHFEQIEYYNKMLREDAYTRRMESGGYGY